MTDAAVERWLLYDRDCGLCTRWAMRLTPALSRHGIRCAPLQEPWVASALKLSEPEILQEMRLLERDGTFTSGASAVVRLSRLFWWGRPLSWLANLPGGRALLDQGYRWIARNRACNRAACRTRRMFPVAHLILLPVALMAIIATSLSGMPAWGVMWLIAAIIWLWLKVATLLHARGKGLKACRALLLGYLAWPATDAIAFFTPNPRLLKPEPLAWCIGFLNLVLGAGMITIAPHFAPLLAGWLAMTGIVLCLHFGSFKLIGLLWQARGVDARPLMDFPLNSRSLGEFWGRRWNTGFSTPARELLFEPLALKWGRASALALVFLISGLVHELAISLPARGGYGLPTLYFIAQGAAILLERSHVGRRLGLGRGLRGRAFALFCAAAPAFWLFHPPFVEGVILPFLAVMTSMKGAWL